MKKALGIKSAQVDGSDSDASEEDQFGGGQGEKKAGKDNKKQSNTIMQ